MKNKTEIEEILKKSLYPTIKTDKKDKKMETLMVEILAHKYGLKKEVENLADEIYDLFTSEKKKWKAEMMKVFQLDWHTVGIASARREDLGTPKADPDSEFNKGYRDGQNKFRQQLRDKLEKI